MTRAYYVNPNNTADIRATDLDDQVLMRPSTFLYRLPGDRLIYNPSEVDDVYLAIEDAGICPNPEYYVPTFARTFEGAVHSAAARVRETLVCTPISMDDLRARKLADLMRFSEFVRVQSARSSEDARFWIDLSVTSRDRLIFYQLFMTDRLKDRVLGKDSSQGYRPPPAGDDPQPATYWPARNIPIVVIRDSNGAKIVSSSNELSWGQILKDVGFYEDARGDAAIAVSNAIEAAYDAGDRAALETLDVEDGTWGWPDYYVRA